jgi:hypothetical protein
VAVLLIAGLAPGWLVQVGLVPFRPASARLLPIGRVLARLLPIGRVLARLLLVRRAPVRLRLAPVRLVQVRLVRVHPLLLGLVLVGLAVQVGDECGPGAEAGGPGREPPQRGQRDVEFDDAAAGGGVGTAAINSYLDALAVWRALKVSTRVAQVLHALSETATEIGNLEAAAAYRAEHEPLIYRLGGNP